MLLLGVGPIEVVRADDVDGGGGGASLNHVHYVVRVRDVEPANTNTRFKGWKQHQNQNETYCFARLKYILLIRPFQTQSDGTTSYLS